MRSVGALGGLLLAMAAAPVSADTVVLQQTGTPAALELFHVPLPGAGTYRFDVSGPGPSAFQIEAGYTYHWDVFLAPPPRPHSEFIEGNTADVSDLFSASGTSASFTFTVPETELTFFPAPEFYEAFGIAPGTPLYREDKFEDPFFSLFITPDIEGGRADLYGFSITRLDAVPEPGAWALMILGFATVGVILRRRRALA